MNDGFLLAECVINYLVNTGFIYNTQNWKHKTKELYYPVSFLIADKRASVVVFEITVENGVHRIPKSRIRFIENRFSINLSEMFISCHL
ncbi:MAG: hypothetical protein LBC77_01715 [Spirochaetaceae bacterium]|jgi:hypothetical protein|nr:hypothetical protein [Spirochaetaceae bacterium]